MKNLQKLSPAEVCLILDGKFMNERECLKLTFQDLLMRGYLKIDSDVDEDKVYVEMGKLPQGYEPRVHEYVFFRAFDHDEELYWPLPSLIKDVVKRVKKGYSFPRDIYSEYLTEYATQSWWQRLWGNLMLTHKGERLRKELRDEIAALKQQLAGKEDDAEEIKRLRKRIGANLHLVVAGAAEHLPDMNREMMTAAALTTYATTGHSGCGGYMWDSSYDSEFDAGYDSGCSSNSWGGGCSGDSSGCGGDSGCGGGCGGD
ncbi:MAG: hypothetical protein WBB45_14930 [Cyclobacteriaceae bacterium]